MKRSPFSIPRRPRCLLAAALVVAARGGAAAPDDAPGRSERDLRLKVSLDQEGKPFFYLGDTSVSVTTRPGDPHDGALRE